MTPHKTERLTHAKITLFAAGSLSQAFKDVATVAQTKLGIALAIECGATARMARLIEDGAACDLFVAADMQTPQKFVDDGRAAAVIPLIRNDTVAVARKDLGLTSATLQRFLSTAVPPASVFPTPPRSLAAQTRVSLSPALCRMIF